MQENRLDTVKNEFLRYLSLTGLSPKSLKNYKSDLNHFMSWAIAKIKSYGSYADSLTDLVPFLSAAMTTEYKAFMLNTNTPKKTTNRRLSTLRHLAKFLNSSEFTNINFMDQIENISLYNTSRKKSVDPLLNQFKSYLESEKVSPNTVKNYLNDIKQFMSWLERNSNP